jgi:hypothetical protein
MNSEMTKKGAVVANLKLLFQNLPGNDDKTKNTSVRIDVVLAET